MLPIARTRAGVRVLGAAVDGPAAAGPDATDGDALLVRPDVSGEIDTGADASRVGAMAKLKGSETYVNAARLGMQILAGHGFATESVMSFRYRESIVAPISGGTSQIQRNAIARSMGLRGY